MKKYIYVLFWLWLNFTFLFSVEVIIGNGEDIGQHLPCDPFYNHSASQLIYDSDYFPYSGLITQIAFQYQLNTANPEDYLGEISIMLGESLLNSFQDEEDYIDLNQLELCFTGDLTQANFQATNNNGAGWLMITLDQPFDYSRAGNLILFFLENNSEAAFNGDNFLAFTTNQNTSMCFIDIQNPLDLDNLIEPMFIRNKLPNSIFEIIIDDTYPQIIYPLNNAEGIATTTALQIKVADLSSTEITVYSSSNVFDLILENNISPLGEGLYEIYPQLPFAPNSYYEWQVISTLDNIEYESDLFSFDTAEAEEEFNLASTGTDSYTIHLAWNSLYDNQYPYTIYRDGEVLATLNENSFIDTQVASGETYEYQVKFFYLDNSFIESDIYTVELVGTENEIINEDFESYSSFQQDLGNWQNIDNDGSTSYSLAGYEFPNQGVPSAFLVFEPGATTPPLDLNINGEKCLVSFASSLPPTSDLIISPAFQTSQVEIDIYLQSLNTSWGMERVKCGLIYNNNSDESYAFNNGNYCEIGEEMTHLNFVHQTPNAEDTITNFWLESCGVQTLMLIIDRIVISSSHTSNDDSLAEDETKTLLFPNPITQGSFELVNQRGDASVKIYNLKGQLVYQAQTSRNKPKIFLPNSVSSGIYLVKIISSNEEIIRKISVLK